MGIKLSQLNGEPQPLDVVYTVPKVPVTVHVEYMPTAFTARVEDLIADITDSTAARDVAEILSAMLASWNLTDDDGAPIPTTKDGLMSVPTTFLVRVLTAINEASHVDPKNAEG